MTNFPQNLKSAGPDEPLYEEALRFVAIWQRLANERELRWGMEAIHYADIHGYKLKNSSNYLDRLRFDEWKLKVEYYISKNLLLYNPNVDYKRVHFLDKNFHDEMVRIDTTIRHYEREEGMLNKYRRGGSAF